MTEQIRTLIEKLARDHRLTREEYRALLDDRSDDAAELLASYARSARDAVYGNVVFVRGLIEVSNICRKDCYYCGIRKSNAACSRYRLTSEQILECCDLGHSLGFRTFVMQGGEDGYFTDDILIPLLREVKRRYPDCAVTLSLGERSRESYEKLFDAGADRYLLRHETANPAHYARLHPANHSFEERMRCLRDLKDIGYQTGCGFMVGSPYQTADDLVGELLFYESFAPDMCGIGPFIPHADTPFGQERAGSVDVTCFLLSILRLIKPNILLPATTALGSLGQDGRVRGVLAGANVVMPNLSPPDVRSKYALYNNKAAFGAESAQGLALLREQMQRAGCDVVMARGDAKR